MMQIVPCIVMMAAMNVHAHCKVHYHDMQNVPVHRHDTHCDVYILNMMYIITICIMNICTIMHRIKCIVMPCIITIYALSYIIMSHQSNLQNV